MITTLLNQSLSRELVISYIENPFQAPCSYSKQWKLKNLWDEFEPFIREHTRELYKSGYAEGAGSSPLKRSSTGPDPVSYDLLGISPDKPAAPVYCLIIFMLNLLQGEENKENGLQASDEQKFINELRRISQAFDSVAIPSIPELADCLSKSPLAIIFGREDPAIAPKFEGDLSPNQFRQIFFSFLRVHHPLRLSYSF